MQILPHNIILQSFEKENNFYPYQLRNNRDEGTITTKEIHSSVKLRDTTGYNNMKYFLTYPKSLRANATAQKLGTPLLITCQPMQM